MNQTLIKYCFAIFSTVGICLPSHAETINNGLLEQVNNYSDTSFSSELHQETNVNQLRDVLPTDWAYEALRSLVERYGCIQGYPDNSFRGNSALSRYEFAAGLNACLQQIERLIAQSETLLREDLEKLQRLMQEFAAELASLDGKIDNLEGRVAFLEDHQFSTTTKLLGAAVFAVNDVWGGDGNSNQTVLQDRVTLNLVSSFSGKDLLLLNLSAGNVPVSNNGGSFELPGTDVGGVSVSTAEGTLSSQFAANTNNSVKLLFSSYQFPISDRLNFIVNNGFGVFHTFAPTLNPYFDDLDGGRGAISTFAQRNPIYSIGGGTGVGANYQLAEQFLLTASYMAGGASASDPDEGEGLFNGNYSALGQLTWQASEQFSVATIYSNSYATPGTAGINYNSLLVSGTAVANTLAGQVRLGTDDLFKQQPVIANSYGGQFSWQPTPKFALGGWFTAVFPRLIGRGDGEVLTYALTFAFPDLGREGNLLGFVVGAEPYLTSFEGGDPQAFEVDVPLHLEAFYRHQINQNISITPGFVWLTAPNQDNDNPDSVIATLRTTFQF
ncbi:putative S-layer protein [Xenococcus sp. PCC 7305]|uniref:iron uptake porin n=1 Tax=Xenococcus sp. PCC 7305 TaxID=102125 RepID=UPI0002AC635E|nr:iron uptake porin [Xenococcus sp. PCC 7305]ELS04661.1 putative S-layer protein [Xenococcus sp. PCC 7305]